VKKHHFYSLSAAGLLLLPPGPARAADETLSGLKAPAAAEVPWTPPDTRSLANELQAGETFNIDPDKEYELPELIDLAERANPETKAAWEQARAAAAAARFQAGLGTEPGVAQAHQQAVAANFDLEEAQVAVRDAQVKLCERVGLLPTTPLRVADFSKLAMPTNLEDTVERVLDHTWSQRPDLLARVALLRARSEAVRQAREIQEVTDAGVIAEIRARMTLYQKIIPIVLEMERLPMR